jgi:hypothetical protein
VKSNREREQPHDVTGLATPARQCGSHCRHHFLLDQFPRRAGWIGPHIDEDDFRRHLRRARYGGEEFVAIFSETDEACMQVIADNYRRAVRDPGCVHQGSDKGMVAVSIGVAVMTADSDLRGPADLIRAADAALYRAKGAGRDCVRVADVPDRGLADRGVRGHREGL